MKHQRQTWLIGDGDAQPRLSKRPRRRRLRRRRAVLLTMLLFSAAALCLTRLPMDRIAAAAIDRLARGSGVSFTTMEPTGFGLFPDFHLELHTVRLQPLSGAPLLAQAESIEIALPLRVLWNAKSKPGAIRVRGLRVDVDGLLQWRAGQRDLGPAPAPKWPVIPARLQFDDTQVALRGAALRFDRIEASALRAGRRWSLWLAGAMSTADAGTLPLDLQLSGVPVDNREGLALSEARLRFGADADAPAFLELEGEMTWAPPARLQFDLIGLLGMPPLSWPRTNVLKPEQFSPALLVLNYRGAPDFSDALGLRFAGFDARAEAKVSVAKLLSDPLASLLTSTIRLSAPQLQVGGVLIEGLSVGESAQDSNY